MIKKRIIFFILPIIIGVIASTTGFDLIWRLFFLSLLVPLLSYSWTLLSVKGIRGQTDGLPPKSRAGDTFESSLHLTNLSKIPKFQLRLQENVDLPGYSNISLINLPSSANLEIPSRIKCLQRGEYALGSYTITASDPLGMFSRSIVIGHPQKILVFPNAVDLPFFNPLTFVNQGYGQGRWLVSQTSPNVATIRDYVNGDSLKHVHWRTTAHSAKLMVKVYDPDRSSNSAKNIWLVLDMHKAAQAGSGLESTEEYIVTIAASIAKKFIENSWPVGLIAMSDQPYVFPLETGSSHLESIDTALAVIKSQGSVPIEQLINSESSRFDLNSMTIIITPSWNDRLVNVLLQIKKQQGMIAVILLDPKSFGQAGGMAGIPGSLIQNGVQVYVVKKGANLAKDLDSRDL